MRLHVGPEVTQQCWYVDKIVVGFDAAQMTVIALAALVVVSDNPLPVNNINQSALEPMTRGGHGRGQIPDNDLDNAIRSRLQAAPT